MIGLSALARVLTETLSGRCGTPVLAGRVENPVYPCCLAELAGETELENRQVRRRVQVTLTCYPSAQRGREEGMQLLDRLELAAAEGFTVSGRKLCPQKLESRITGKELPQVRFALDFYDAPGAEETADSGGNAETMAALELTLETVKEE